MNRFEDPKQEEDIKNKCKVEWDSDPAIRKEFKSLDVYTSYRLAEEAGQTKAGKGYKTTPHKQP